MSDLQIYTAQDRFLRANLNPFVVFLSAWRNRVLIRRLTERQLSARYRGSMLGLLWTVITPLLMLGLYTFVFGVVLLVKWQLPAEAKGNFALLLFSGLIIYTFFAEVVTRAPSLMLENTAYIKKLVFPLEALVFTSLASAAVNALIGLGMLIAFYIAILGSPPLTVLLAPVVLLPISLTALGMSWVLASVGVFMRDIGLILNVVINVFLFFSPVFYPLSSVPEAFRFWIMLNPITPAVESLRAVLFLGQLPDAGIWCLSLMGGLVLNWLGFCWFQATRKAFADVC